MKAERLFLVATLACASASAAPINTDTALPVHKGELLWREQVRFLKAEDSTRDLEVIAVPSVLVYGFTEKFALIGVAPYLDKDFKTGGVERGDHGLGDVTLLGRYQVLQLDRPGETFRAQLLGGLKLPTGKDDQRDSLGRMSASPTLQASLTTNCCRRRTAAAVCVMCPTVVGRGRKNLRD